jgi:Na+-transporting NADH:ubiquinone oxidoreductase subunit C
MNKQSNTYTIIYIIIAVVVVGAALAVTAMSLRDKQQANADADKMQQIINALHQPETTDNIKDVFNEIVTAQIIVNDSGETVYTADKGDSKVFDINIADEITKDADQRQLPVYVCQLKDGSTKYILPVYGAGLWGPIWGYVAVDDNGSTIYGAYFSHSGETPGLGAEIEKPYFGERFIDKQLFKNGEFLPVAVVKAGQHPANDADYVDGISGGTITSKGVGAMLDNCLSPYKAFLQNLSNK